MNRLRTIVTLASFLVLSTVAEGENSNSIDLGGQSGAGESLKERIVNQFARPDSVTFKLVIAELQPADRRTEKQQQDSNNPREENAPCMAKDGVAGMGEGERPPSNSQPAVDSDYR